MQNLKNSYEGFFRKATGFAEPYEWQVRVAQDGLPELLPVPTGLGKTEGVALAWAWRRFINGDAEPQHLVYCLPMRSLVRQTVERLRRYFARLRDEVGFPEIPVYSLLGGTIEKEWANSPDVPWVLVGTQDQLLSRALNRGYAMSRFQWPIHFGLLNQDCHWIVDEVQLMGPGLWTTAQLDWMRRKRFFALKRCGTTWMSATVGSSFLATVDRKRDGLDCVDPFEAKLDSDTNKEMSRRLSAVRAVQRIDDSLTIVDRASKEHLACTLSLIVCNTVGSAQKIFESLGADTPKILLTSRFRPHDRSHSERRLFEFEMRRASVEGVAAGDPGLICVSTQVIEAGVDVSAHRLWSEIAPFPSIIQRMGRLNRDGCDPDAKAYFWKSSPEKNKKFKDYEGPYLKNDLEDATKLLDRLEHPSHRGTFRDAMSELERVEPELLNKVLQPTPQPLPRALDVHGLFSTEQDVHGGFTDVSAFIRNADPDADLTVFWRTWDRTTPPKDDALSGPAYDPDEGCAVPFFTLQKVLKNGSAKAWTWDDQLARWTPISSSQLRPGMLVMLHRETGGYSETLGWTGLNADKIDNVAPAGPLDSMREDRQTDIGYWSSLEAHLKDTRLQAELICDAIDLRADGQNAPFRAAVIESAGLHDLGKAHPAWQNALPASRSGEILAKCPVVLRALVIDATVRGEIDALLTGAASIGDEACEDGITLRWAVDKMPAREQLNVIRAMPQVQWVRKQRFRPNLRHEAASALAMWKRYHDRDCPYPALAVYLAAAHHGKVRTVLRSTGDKCGDVFGVPSEPDILHLDGSAWPMDFSVAIDGAAGEWHEDRFVLTGFGWTGLVSDLLGPWRPEDSDDAGVVPRDEPRYLGPFALAWLEGLVRTADARASESPSQGIKPSELVHV